MKKRFLLCLVILATLVTFVIGASAATEITTAAQIKTLMDATDAATMGGDYVLMNDIDMSGVSGQSSIGVGTVSDYTRAFTGTFDGNGYTISGLNITGTADGIGLFGMVVGATIENLTVSGTVNGGGQTATGGIVGMVRGNDCTSATYEKTVIRNCVNYCTVSNTASNGRAGGIVGVVLQNAKKYTGLEIIDCVNYGSITSPKHNGGIIGRIEEGNSAGAGNVYLISGCVNFAPVTNTASNADGAGGILGTALPRSFTLTVENCYNSGAVSSAYRVGGIVGSVASYETGGAVTIRNNVNMGAVTATATSSSYTCTAGGILGEFFNGTKATLAMNGNFNGGAITSKSPNVGHIFGGVVSTATLSQVTLDANNCFASTAKLTTGTSGKTTGVTKGGTTVKVANGTATAGTGISNLASASVYPSGFNTNGTFLYSENGPYAKAVHEHLIALDGTKCICSLCEAEILTTSQIDGETWIQLKSAQDLLLLMANSKAGNKDALSYNYILTTDVNLKDFAGMQFPIGQYEANAGSPTTKLHFTGKFDGNDHTVSGLSMAAGTLHGGGLFASIYGTPDAPAVVRNLTVEGTFTGSRFIGAVVGLIFGSATVENCETTANTTVTFTGRTGGGVIGAAVYNVTGYYVTGGHTVVLKNLVNNAAVTTSSTDSRVGGVIGQVNTSTVSDGTVVMENIVNKGTVKGGTDVGGTVGRLEIYSGTAEVTGFENEGTVTATGSQVGGLFGYVIVASEQSAMECALEISDCHNKGTVTTSNGNNVGGISGLVISNAKQEVASISISDCTNSGAITGGVADSNVGGVIGYIKVTAGPTDVTVTRAANTGKITAKGTNGRAGGVIGNADTDVSTGGTVTISECLNIGEVVATVKRAGGIIAYMYTKGGTNVVTERCVNVGKVSAPEDVGGITALNNGGKVIGCINNGQVVATGANVGGIVGWIAGASYIQECLNMASISGNGTNMAGIVGKRADSPTLTDNYYMAGTTADSAANATSVTAAVAKEMLMDWCLTYGLNADSEEPANSDHYFVGTSTTCAICGAEAHSKHASSVTMVERVVIEETCVDNGSKFMVCPTCLIRGEEIEIPANPDKHVIGWNENGDYGCTREGCDYVQYAAADYTAVYVSASGDNKADGKTVATAVASFTQAMDIAARSDNDVTVYLVGKVSPTARQIDSTYNTFANSFEEMPHTNTITITSAEGKNGELHFTDAARRYFLYGPTTFENIKISCAVTNGVYLFARGFEITMGEGLTMVDSKADDPSTTDVVEGKTKESKTDAAVAGLGLTTYVSDVKLYVYGGFYKETDSKTGATKTGSYAGADMETYNANISILSGEFWTVCAFNRGFGETQNMENATATITVGDIVAAYVIGTTTDGADMNNVVVNMHYTAPAQIARGFRFAYSANSAGSGNTANHFFYAGAAGMKFGDFGVGSKLSGVDVNTYYAVALTDDPTVLALSAKNARYPEYRTGTITFTTLPEYCLDTLGGHTFVSDVCSFCGVKKCDNTTKGHTYVWDTETGTAICVGDCTSTLNVNNYSAVYVSDNGRVGAAGTKADPFGSFRQAIDVAAAANKDMTVYLVGTVTLKARQYSGENTYVYAFEEAPHDNKITVASESTNNKGTLKFTSSCYMYYLYGETVFQNIKIAAQRTGGNYFFGRGFKLTMDNGLTMVDINGKTETVKNNDTIAKFGTTVKTSDIKLYVFGGFLLNGNTNGLYEGMTTADIAGISTDVTVLSGSYWTIGGGSRGAASIARDGMNVKMTIGAVTSAYIIPLTSDGCVINNTTVNMHFTGKFNAALVYRFAFDGASTGSGNVINNFYYKGARDAKVGDMPVGSANCPTEINLYYANSIDASSAILEGIRQKNSIYAQTYQQIGEEMCFSEWCVERGGGHTWNSNGVCTFCEITECMHTNTAWSVVREANCVTTGVEANRCTVCFEHVEEREIPVDATAHKLVWVYGADAYVATCQNAGCTYTVTKAYPTVSEVHVSASGSADGDGSENNPLNDFGAAMAIAAAQDTDVTVYIHDMAIIPDSGHAELNVYLEPAHADNKITVTSYGDTRATLRFNSNTPRGYTILYALSGPTTFENIEFSSWDTQSRFYMAARHYPLVLGEGITVDYQRGTDQSVAGSDMIIIGGCYGTKTLPDGGCENKDVNLTVLSGSYGAIIGGAYLNGTCCVDEYTVKHDNGTPDNANDDYTTTHSGGDIHLTLGGDLVVRRQLYTGNYGDSTRYGSNNNIYIDIVGNISVGSTFGFGPAGVYYTDAGKTQSAPYTAKNVYLNLYDGFISGGSFYGTNDTLKPFVLGAVVDGGSPVDRIAGKLYISADVTNRYANAAFKDLLAALGAHDIPGDKWEATIWDEGYCTVNGGDHTPMGDAIDSAAATCTAEGYVVYVCSGCGEEYVEVLEREAHVYDGSTSIAATCIAPAMEKQLCTVCNAPQYTVTGSEFGAHTEPVGGFCQLCNADLSVDCDHVNASTEAVVVGCGTGTKWYCPDCDKTVVDLPAAEHNYGKYVVTVEPTETQTGLKTRTCKGCGKVDTAILYATDAVNASAVATTENGEVAYDVVASKLSKSEKVALNALLQESAYGAEVKVSYETNGSGALNVTYNIPVPAAYTDYTDVRIAVKDDEGKIHFVDFKIEKGYIVFTF